MSRLLTLGALVATSALAADPAPKPVFVPCEVMELVDTEDGVAVLLLDKAAGTVLPIFIGPNEGMAINLRLKKQLPPRPLTHDLLEDVLTELGGKLLRVEIDDLKANTFLGRLVIEQHKKVKMIDARPSDSIAVALGLGAPILVAKPVLERAGVPLKEFGKQRKRASPSESL